MYDSDRAADASKSFKKCDEIVEVLSPPEKKRPKQWSEKEELLDMRKIEHDLIVKEKSLNIEHLKLACEETKFKIELLKYKLNEKKGTKTPFSVYDAATCTIGDINDRNNLSF